MKEAFTDWKPKTETTRTLLIRAVGVVSEYAAQGYQLTLRQLYYQLVARDVIPNSQQWYERLGGVVSNGRMAGFIDWSAIVDRGRVPIKPPDWSGPDAILRSAELTYRLDRWEGQQNHVEVWCEKDALSSALKPICSRYHVRMLANRGYSSATALYDAAQRFQDADSDGKRVVVIYLGDHDPSGMDMTRDIRDRFDVLSWFQDIEVRRLALNMDQVERYGPPPNPTKFSDSRAMSYVSEYGPESWELDALEPQVLDQLVSGTIDDLLDRELFDERVRQEEADKVAIRLAAEAMVSDRE